MALGESCLSPSLSLLLLGERRKKRDSSVRSGAGALPFSQQGRDGSSALKRWMLQELTNQNCRSSIPGRRQLPGVAIHVQHGPGAGLELSCCWGFTPCSSTARPGPLPAPFPDPRLGPEAGPRSLPWLPLTCRLRRRCWNSSNRSPRANPTGTGAFFKRGGSKSPFPARPHPPAAAAALLELERKRSEWACKGLQPQVHCCCIPSCSPASLKANGFLLPRSCSHLSV